MNTASPPTVPMTHKLHEGRGDPVLEPDLPVVDAHHHLFDRPALRYLMEDYLRDAGSGHRVVASVYVETRAFAWTLGPELLRPLGEVAFANAVGTLCATGAYGPARCCAAIVGYADMREGDAVARLLDRAMEMAPDRFRGVRQPCLEFRNPAAYRYSSNPPPRGTLESPAFRQAFRHLGVRGLSFDAAVLHHQLPRIASLADTFPDTVIVLNHLGIAEGFERDVAGRAEAFDEWRRELKDLARRPNVMCKIGGLGMPFWGLGLEERTEPTSHLQLSAAWKPYVETGIECFGVDRCMMSSNYPVDGRSGSVERSEAHREQLFEGSPVPCHRGARVSNRPVIPKGRERPAAGPLLQSAQQLGCSTLPRWLMGTVSRNTERGASARAGSGTTAAEPSHPDTLSPRTRARLESISHERSWNDGDVLLHAGEVPRWVICLQEGRLRVSHIRANGVEDLRKGTRLGGTLGLVSVVAQRPFSFSVTAAGPCRTRLYDAHQLLALMRSDGDVALDLARSLAFRAAELEEATLEDRDETLVDRVHAALLRLHRLGVGRPVVGGFALRVSQYDLACMVGSSRQYVNLQLRHLQEEGVIRTSYRSIVLVQPAPTSGLNPADFARNSETSRAT